MNACPFHISEQARTGHPNLLQDLQLPRISRSGRSPIRSLARSHRRIVARSVLVIKLFASTLGDFSHLAAPSQEGHSQDRRKMRPLYAALVT